MYGSLIYSNTGISSTDGVVSMGQHTHSINLLNLSQSTDAVVNLNGKYSVLIPHRPNQTQGVYTNVTGDYTSVEVITADCSVAIFAIG